VAFSIIVESGCTFWQQTRVGANWEKRKTNDEPARIPGAFDRKRERERERERERGRVSRHTGFGESLPCTGTGKNGICRHMMRQTTRDYKPEYGCWDSMRYMSQRYNRWKPRLTGA
jgi:hypothetical protein